jgi:CheY-like chemotaxis protein
MDQEFVILVVDDDKDDLQIFLSAVVDVDNTIFCYTAYDGFDALKKLTQDGAAIPNIIFVDLNMPRMDGKQFLIERNKIENLAAIPVVIYSTTRRAEDVEEAKQLGAFDFISKPFQYNLICDALRQILSKIRVVTHTDV